MTSHWLVAAGGGSSRRSSNLDRRDCGAAAQRQRSLSPLASGLDLKLKLCGSFSAQIDTKSHFLCESKNNLIQSPLKVELHEIEHRFRFF